jgi:hypothetical protein
MNNSYIIEMKEKILNKLILTLKLFIKRILSRLPTKLPVGMTQFETWAKDIIELSGKFADETSMKFALASMVQHADSKYGSLPKNYFVVRLRKVAANQVASQVFLNIKEQQAAAQVAQQAKNVEDTAVNTADVKPV